MQYSKEVIEARKVYDGLIIERRELAKELAEIKAEIEDKLAGKPTARKFEVLKKRQVEVEARLADMPGLIADARDALVIALKADASEKSKEGAEAIEASLADIVPVLEDVQKRIHKLDQAMEQAAKKLSAVTGEPVAISGEWLLNEAVKRYMADGNTDFIGRLRNRIDTRLHELLAAVVAQIRNQADSLRKEAIR